MARQVLTSLAENQAKLDALLPHAELEVWCIGWFSKKGWAAEAAIGLQEAVAFSRLHLPLLRAKQLALRGRSLKGRGAISNAQALMLHQIIPAWCSATKAATRLAKTNCWRHLAALVTHRKAQHFISPQMLESLRASSIDTTAAASEETRELVNSFAEAVRRARVSMFYVGGSLHKCHKYFLDDVEKQEKAQRLAT